jgi:hypothetical protein
MKTPPPLDPGVAATVETLGDGNDELNSAYGPGHICAPVPRPPGRDIGVSGSRERIGLQHPHAWRRTDRTGP